MFRRAHSRFALLAWAGLYAVISLPFTLAAAVFCLALFHLFTLAGLRAIEILGIGDPVSVAAVLGVMFALFLAVYLGELPALMAGVRRAHRRATSWIGRRAQRV